MKTDLEFVRFNVNDVITTSTCECDGCEQAFDGDVQ